MQMAIPIALSHLSSQSISDLPFTSARGGILGVGLCRDRSWAQ